MTPVPEDNRRRASTCRTCPADTIPETCHRALHDLAHARREDRDVSPELSDALDNAMEALRTALTIIELEGADNG